MFIVYVIAYLGGTPFWWNLDSFVVFAILDIVSLCSAQIFIWWIDQIFGVWCFVFSRLVFASGLFYPCAPSCLDIPVLQYQGHFGILSIPVAFLLASLDVFLFCCDPLIQVLHIINPSEYNLLHLHLL